MFVNYAHRGASSYYPENTLSSFYAGLDIGANGIETDIQKTRDGVLVLFHDDTIERVTEGSGTISEHTYAELMQLDVRNDAYQRTDKIVTLEDFLRYFSFRDLTFAIELKQSGIEEETLELLDRYHMEQKAVITSFDYDSVAKTKRLRPRYRAGFLAEIPIDDALLDKMKADGIEELCPDAHVMTPEKMTNWKARGFEVRAWGVYTPEIMNAAYRLGVCGMTVNFPDLLTRLILRESPAGYEGA